MARRHSQKNLAVFDRELADLPQEMRWRTWMGRVEAVVFAASKPVPREVLAKLVGQGCRLDELLDDIRDELRGRPYELVQVAGGWQHRTRKNFADAIGVSGVVAQTAPSLTAHETLVLTAIAYLQPVTRAELRRMLGREVSRDTIAGIRSAAFVTAGPRAPQPGAPATYVTTPAFLSAFGFATLRDLPDLEVMEEGGLLEKSRLGDAVLPGEDDTDMQLADSQADSDGDAISAETQLE